MNADLIWVLVHCQCTTVDVAAKNNCSSKIVGSGQWTDHHDGLIRRARDDATDLLDVLFRDGCYDERSLAGCTSRHKEGEKQNRAHR